MANLIESSYELVAHGFMYGKDDIREELEHRGQSDLLDNVLSVLRATDAPKRQLRELNVNKWAIEHILDYRETVYTATKTDTFYTIHGIDTETVERVRYNKETGLGTAEIKEVSYSYEYDIDQEVYDCDDRECVRNVVTDVHETKHEESYEINIIVDLTGGN